MRGRALYRERVADWRGDLPLPHVPKGGWRAVHGFRGRRGSEFEVSRGAIATFRSSEIAERGFCAQCGTPLTYRVLGRDRVSFTLGSLDRPGGVAPIEQLGIEARLAWFDGLHALPGETMQGWLERQISPRS